MTTFGAVGEVVVDVDVREVVRVELVVVKLSSSLKAVVLVRVLVRVLVLVLVRELVRLVTLLVALLPEHGSSFGTQMSPHFRELFVQSSERPLHVLPVGQQPASAPTPSQ